MQVELPWKCCQVQIAGMTINLIKDFNQWMLKFERYILLGQIDLQDSLFVLETNAHFKNSSLLLKLAS